MATYSRQAYLTSLVVVVLLLCRRNVLMAILLGALMATTFSLLLPDSVTQRVTETQVSTGTGESEIDSSTASRFDIWKGAIRMWQDHPGGVGLNRFKEHIGHYSHIEDMDAHNAYLLMLAECGPLGLAALLWLIWRLWGMARRFHQPDPTEPEAKALAVGFTLAVTAMAFGNLSSSFIFHALAMGNFWILCGLLERYAALKEHAAGVVASGSSATMPAVANPFERYPLLARARPGYQRRD